MSKKQTITMFIIWIGVTILYVIFGIGIPAIAGIWGGFILSFIINYIISGGEWSE